MPDRHTPEQRSRNMARIRGKDTRPEKAVRSLLHRLGYRYRLHSSNLPGKPDIVFPSRRKIIFVHGCFWHMHQCRWRKTSPVTNAEFWRVKRGNTVKRDKQNLAALRNRGWKTHVVWECELKDLQALRSRLESFLSKDR